MPTHWKKLTNPNYLGAYSIENGQDLILTIKYVQEEKVIGTTAFTLNSKIPPHRWPINQFNLSLF